MAWWKVAELGIDFGVPALMLALGVLFVWKVGGADP
jgi:hypothetical protein